MLQRRLAAVATVAQRLPVATVGRVVRAVTVDVINVCLSSYHNAAAVLTLVAISLEDLATYGAPRLAACVEFTRCLPIDGRLDVAARLQCARLMATWRARHQPSIGVPSR